MKLPLNRVQILRKLTSLISMFCLLSPDAFAQEGANKGAAPGQNAPQQGQAAQGQAAPNGVTVGGVSYKPPNLQQVLMDRALEQYLAGLSQSVTGRKSGEAVTIEPGEFQSGVKQAYLNQWVDSHGNPISLSVVEGALLVQQAVLQQLTNARLALAPLHNLTDAQKGTLIAQLQKLASTVIPKYQTYMDLKDRVGGLAETFRKYQTQIADYEEQLRLGVAVEVHERPFLAPSMEPLPPSEQAAGLEYRRQEVARLKKLLNESPYQQFLNAQDAFYQALSANPLLGVQVDGSGPHLFEQLLQGTTEDWIKAFDQAVAQSESQLTERIDHVSQLQDAGALRDEMGSSQYAQSAAAAAASGGDFTQQLVNALQADAQGAKAVGAHDKAFNDFIFTEILVASSLFPGVGTALMIVQVFRDRDGYVVAVSDEKNAKALAGVEGYEPVISAGEAREAAGEKYATSVVTTGATLGLQQVAKALSTGKNVKLIYNFGGKSGRIIVNSETAGITAAAANDAKVATTAANSASTATAPATIASSNPKVLKGLEVAKNLGLKDVETYVNAINTPPTSDLTAGAALAATNNLMILSGIEEAKAAALAAGLPRATIDAIVNQAKSAGTIGAFAEVPRNLAVAGFVNDGNVLLMDTGRAGRVADYFREIGLPVQDNKAVTGLMGLKQEINFAVRNGRLPKLTSTQLALLRNDVIPNGNSILKWYTTIGNEVQPIFDQEFLKNLEKALQQSANSGNTAAAQLLADLKFNTLEASAPAVPGPLVTGEAGLSLTGNATPVDEIAASFGSKSYNQVLLGESIGGNAGPGHAAVNAVVDSANGQIIAFGNPQDLNPAILPANNANNVLVSFRVRVHIGNTAIPATIDSYVAPEGLSAAGRNNIEQAIAKYNGSLRGSAAGLNPGPTNPSSLQAATATQAAGATAIGVNNNSSSANSTGTGSDPRLTGQTEPSGGTTGAGTGAGGASPNPAPGAGGVLKAGSGANQPPSSNQPPPEKEKSTENKAGNDKVGLNAQPNNGAAFASASTGTLTILPNGTLQVTAPNSGITYPGTYDGSIHLFPPGTNVSVTSQPNPAFTASAVNLGTSSFNMNADGSVTYRLLISGLPGPTVPPSNSGITFVTIGDDSGGAPSDPGGRGMGWGEIDTLIHHPKPGGVVVAEDGNQPVPPPPGPGGEGAGAGSGSGSAGFIVPNPLLLSATNTAVNAIAITLDQNITISFSMPASARNTPLGRPSLSAQFALTKRGAAPHLELASLSSRDSRLTNEPRAPRSLVIDEKSQALDLSQALYSIVANGKSSGQAAELQVFDPTGKISDPALPEGTVLEPVKLGSAKPVADLKPGAKIVRKPLIAYCVDYMKLPPENGMLYRVAPAAVQARYGDLQSTLQAGRELADEGAYKPDGDVEAYKAFIEQYALWALIQQLTEQQFTELFRQKTKEKAAAAKMKWTDQLDRTVTALAPKRWRDILLVKQRAAEIAKRRKTQSLGSKTQGQQ